MTAALLYAIGFVAIGVGLAGLLLPAMPGAPVIFLGLVSIAWADGFTRIGWPGLLVLGLLSVLVSVVDTISGVGGARRFGASRWGMLGALLGALVGLPLGLIGLAAGPLIGAVAFEYLKDPDFRRASRVGAGTLIGFVVGTAVKYALAFFMLCLALLFYFT
jgi:uncharacterized protein YqgC (DUF456 family)